MSKISKIYTKTGDRGETSLYTGLRVKKYDPIIEALGSIDALNSFIGVSISHLEALVEEEDEKEVPSLKEIISQLKTVQIKLFDVGANIATPLENASEHKIEKTKFENQITSDLEEWIDQYTEQLPPLKNFILPGGGLQSSYLHVCRSLCRQAERDLCNLLPKNTYYNWLFMITPSFDIDILPFINRLSDYFFTLARFVSFKVKKEETIWKK